MQGKYLREARKGCFEGTSRCFDLASLPKKPENYNLIHIRLVTYYRGSGWVKDRKDIEYSEEDQSILDDLRKLQEQIDSSLLSRMYSHPLFLTIVRISAKPACTLVFAYYPQFKKDLVKLFHYEYIKETENGLSWEKDKVALAEYFGHQTEKNKNKRWEKVENLFKLKGLKDSFKNAKIKKSKDYEKLLELLKDDPPQGG